MSILVSEIRPWNYAWKGLGEGTAVLHRREDNLAVYWSGKNYAHPVGPTTLLQLIRLVQNAGLYIPVLIADAELEEKGVEIDYRGCCHFENEGEPFSQIRHEMYFYIGKMDAQKMQYGRDVKELPRLVEILRRKEQILLKKGLVDSDEAKDAKSLRAFYEVLIANNSGLIESL